MMNTLIKKTIIKGISVAALSVLMLPANAQTSAIQLSDASAGRMVVKKVLPKRPKPLHTELSVGLRLNTDGWSIFADKGYVRSDESKLRDQFYNLRVFQAELSEHKNPAEKKLAYEDEATGQKSKPFIYGKINNFYSLKLGYGFRRMIAGKPEPGSVSVHWMGVGGFSLGMEKPYYINAYVQQDNTGSYSEQSIKYSEDNRKSFLDEYYIVGGSGFAKGLSEIKFVPGLQAKTGLHFDFAANRKTVLAVEAGIAAELYSRKVQLMATQEGKAYFVNLFASLQFGKRW